MNPMTDPDETKRATQPAKPELQLRWSAKRKAEVALRLLRGEALGTLSRQTAVPVPRLEDWLRQALAGVE